MTPTITITVNGRDQQVADGISLMGLLGSLALDPGAVVVEHNRRIVRRPELEHTSVHDGDVIELVHFVGGG